MARKNLLNESEIRRFMKLANLGAIGDGRVLEMSTPTPKTMAEQGFGMEDEVDVVDVGGEDELDMDLDMDVDEVPEEVPGEEGEGEMTLSDDEALAIIDLADRLRDAMGDEVEGEDELDMDLDMDLEAGEEEELGGEEMMAAGEEELEEPGNRAVYERKGTTKRNNENLVNEVARRVAARLAATEKQEQMVEHLAARILNRLTN